MERHNLNHVTSMHSSKVDKKSLINQGSSHFAKKGWLDFSLVDFRIWHVSIYKNWHFPIQWATICPGFMEFSLFLPKGEVLVTLSVSLCKTVSQYFFTNNHTFLWYYLIFSECCDCSACFFISIIILTYCSSVLTPGYLNDMWNFVLNYVFWRFCLELCLFKILP
jgi:hypothetical protein